MHWWKTLINNPTQNNSVDKDDIPREEVDDDDLIRDASDNVSILTPSNEDSEDQEESVSSEEFSDEREVDKENLFCLEIKNTEEFFKTEIIYRFDVLENNVRETIRGRYLFEIQNNIQDQKVKKWRVNIADELRVLPADETDDCDVSFCLSERDFVDIANGNLNPQLAMISKRVKLTGSIEHALGIQILLAPIKHR